jgi:predicted amidohydrolase YtcJ
MIADLVLGRGRIYTLGRAGLRPVSYLAVKAGVVIAAGGGEVMGLRGPRTTVLELDGRTVLPGFNDAHAHVVYNGLSSFGVELGGCRSVAQIQRRIAARVRGLADGEWCQGAGFSHLELVERRHPTRQELDAVTGGRPAFIDERGGHLRVANSAALAAAGLGRASEDPAGGSLGRDAEGELDGILYESAMRLVADHQPPPSLTRRKQAVLRTQRLLLSRGITSVGAAVNRGFADDLRAYQQLLDEGRLRMRVNQFLSWELLPAARRLGLSSGAGSDRLRAGPIKVFVDGGLSTDAAAMRSGGGVWRTRPDELREMLREAEAGRLQVAAHAIGDAAIEAMADAVEAAGGAGHRHRVEHCAFCPPDLRERLGRLGMVAVMQPLGLRFKADWRARFGDALSANLLCHRDLARAGVRVAFSSDLPVSPDPDPWPGLELSVTDRDQGLSVLAALRAYTEAGAYTSFEEWRKGTLELGRQADFQVLDQDPIADPPASWPELRPRLVAVAGKAAFRPR